MAFPSQVLASGNSGMATEAICGLVRNNLTAVGTNLATALALTGVINRVSTAALSTGVSLPTPEAGAEITIINDGANPITVYAKTGQTVNGAASTTITNAKASKFVGSSPTAWHTLAGA